MYPTATLVGLAAALGHADLDILDEVGRKALGELINVLAVDLLWFALALLQTCRTDRAYRDVKSSVKHLRVEGKEVLRNLTGTRILRAERRNKYRIIAVVVELVVDGTLGEYSAFELVEVSSDFWVLHGTNNLVL
jgi:hypothetical protein